MENFVAINRLDPIIKPDWEPLEELLGSRQCYKFMFLGKVYLVDQTIICCYKHQVKRYYINLSQDGKLWKWDKNKGGYSQLDVDRNLIRSIIILGGDPFINSEGRIPANVIGYCYAGQVYCADCLQGLEASEGEDVVLIPLYESETARQKKCAICDSFIAGGLRDEGISEVEPDHSICEAQNHEPQRA